MDINTLTQHLTSNVTSNVTDQILTWFLIPSIVVALLSLIIYIAHIVRRRKLENAIFEIRDTLREMQRNGQDMTDEPESSQAAG